MSQRGKHRRKKGHSVLFIIFKLGQNVPEENKSVCEVMRIKSRRQIKVRKWGKREINAYGVAAVGWAVHCAQSYILQLMGIDH